MAVSTTTSNSASLHSYFSKKLLKTLQPRLQLQKLAKKESLPQATGKQAEWLIYTKISASTTPLTEGTNPSEISFTTASVTASVAQYGQFSKISDLLESTAIDRVKGLNPLFAKAGAETIEELHVAELDANLTVQRVADAADDDSLGQGDVITMDEFVRGMVTLKAAYVGPHERGSYFAVVHPDNEYDLLSEENQSGWLSVNQYAGDAAKDIMRGEIGKLYGIRFMVSDVMNKADNASSVSIKSNYLIGEECFGAVALSGRSDRGVEVIVKPSDSGGQANALNMFGTVGYKIKAFVSKNFAAARGMHIKGASAKDNQ